MDVQEAVFEPMDLLAELRARAGRCELDDESSCSIKGEKVKFCKFCNFDIKFNRRFKTVIGKGEGREFGVHNGQLHSHCLRNCSIDFTWPMLSC